MDSVRVAPEEVALPLHQIARPRGDTLRRPLELRVSGTDRHALIPMKRMAQPEEPADAIVFLASDSASYITGPTLSVNGGLNML